MSRSYLNRRGVSPESHKELKKQQRRLNDCYSHYSAEGIKLEPLATSIPCFEDDYLVTTKDGVKIINLYKINNVAFGYTPLFIKSSMSVGLATAVTGKLSELALPKSRIFRYFADIGLPLSKAQTIA